MSKSSPGAADAASRYLNFLWLRFLDPDLEAAFQADYRRRVSGQSRASLLLAAALYLGTGFQDPWFFHAAAGQILQIRVCVAMTLLFSFCASFHPRFMKLQQPWLATQGLLGGAGVLLMIALGNLETANSYFFGFTLVVVWTFTLSGLRFYAALATSLILTAAYMGVFGLLVAAPAKWFFTDVSDCLAASMIVAFAGYVIERQRRVLFYQHRVIDRERQSHQQMALFDQLTGLPNRLLFEQRLAEALSHSDRRGDRMAVLFLDVDRFKPVNDSFGHLAGDRVLSVLASRLKSCVRHQDVVARIGGDEFLILIEDIQRTDDVAVVAQKILETVERPLSLRGGANALEPVQVSASIGIALYPQDGRNASGLIQAADSAMYAGKAGGRNGYRFHDGGFAAGAGGIG